MLLELQVTRVARFEQCAISSNTSDCVQAQLLPVYCEHIQVAAHYILVAFGALLKKYAQWEKHWNVSVGRPTPTAFTKMNKDPDHCNTRLTRNNGEVFVNIIATPRLLKPRALLLPIMRHLGTRFASVTFSLIATFQLRALHPEERPGVGFVVLFVIFLALAQNIVNSRGGRSTANDFVFCYRFEMFLGLFAAPGHSSVHLSSLPWLSLSPFVHSTRRQILGKGYL